MRVDGLEDRKTGGQGGQRRSLALHVPELDGGVTAAGSQHDAVVEPDHALHILLMRIRARVLTRHEEMEREIRDLLDAGVRIQIPHENALISTAHENRLGRVALHLTNAALVSLKNAGASEVVVRIRLADADSMRTVYIEKANESDPAGIRTIARRETNTEASPPAHRFDSTSTRNRAG